VSPRRAAPCGSARSSCQLKPGSLAARAYGRPEIEERHRHRYEFNNKFGAQLQSRGLVLSGKCVGRELVEIIELPDHPWSFRSSSIPSSSRALTSRIRCSSTSCGRARAAVARIGHNDYRPRAPRPRARLGSGTSAKPRRSPRPTRHEAFRDRLGRGRRAGAAGGRGAVRGRKRRLCLRVAGHLQAACAARHLPYVFKASYAKANRSSARSFAACRPPNHSPSSNG